MSQYTLEDQQAIELARECYLIGNTGTDEAVVRFARKLREANIGNLLLREDGYPHLTENKE